MIKLAQKQCLPCSGKVPPLSKTEISRYVKQVSGWLVKDQKLVKTFRFKNFTLLMNFVNEMARIAEKEGHHPNFEASYNVLNVIIWTHAIDALTESDFILAAKIDQITS